MRALLVYPAFPKTYWGMQYTFPITGRSGVFPPLGLLTVAAMLPRGWESRLVDLNIETLRDEDLAWADVVMISAMLIQAPSFHEVARRARAAGKKVVGGGPFPTTSPDACGDCDHLVVGEAEDVIAEFCAQLETGTAPARVKSAERPDVSRTPVPRFDMLKKGAYLNMSVQFSRGCPFNCEFCDIIEIFGRVPRTKSPAQMLAELDAIYAIGYRGAVFMVDDNFIGNKKAAKGMLGPLADWQVARGFPFELITEASVNLADDDKLLDGMVKAGFSQVFLGIETPSKEALLETQKRQNTHGDLNEAVDKITRRGIEVMAGFIVGFDHDDEAAFDRQIEFISANPIPLAMVGLLQALPGTQLWRRLEREGRLQDTSDGDQFGRTNFRTTVQPDALARGYGRILNQIYSVAAYYERCLLTLRRLGRVASRKTLPRLWELVILARSLFLQGVVGSERLAYWGFLWRSLWTNWRRFPRAVSMAILAEHLVRYTREDVLPRLALAELPPDAIPHGEVHGAGAALDPAFVPLRVGGAERRN